MLRAKLVSISVNPHIHLHDDESNVVQNRHVDINWEVLICYNDETECSGQA